MAEQEEVGEMTLSVWGGHGFSHAGSISLRVEGGMKTACKRSGAYMCVCARVGKQGVHLCHLLRHRVTGSLQLKCDAQADNAAAAAHAQGHGTLCPRAYALQPLHTCCPSVVAM